MDEASVFAFVLAPARLSVRGVPGLVKPTAPVLLKFTVPADDPIVPLLAPIEKRRSVLAVPVPLNWNEPPSITRFEAALDELPTPLFAPPLFRIVVLKVPPRTVRPPE